MLLQGKSPVDPAASPSSSFPHDSISCHLQLWGKRALQIPGPHLEAPFVSPGKEVKQLHASGHRQLAVMLEGKNQTLTFQLSTPKGRKISWACNKNLYVYRKNVKNRHKLLATHGLFFCTIEEIITLAYITIIKWRCTVGCHSIVYEPYPGDKRAASVSESLKSHSCDCQATIASCLLCCRLYCLPSWALFSTCVSPGCNWSLVFGSQYCHRQCLETLQYVLFLGVMGIER